MEKQFKEFLIESHCDVADEKVMQCLREQDSEVLLSASNTVYDRYSPSNRWAFQPVIDGDIISMQPIKAWEEGHWQRMPVMTGFTTDEGTPFAPKEMSNGKEFRDYMKALIPQMTRRHLKEMQNLYPDPLTTRSSPYKDTRALSTLGLGPQYKRISAAYGEWAYVCPVRETAQFAHKTSNEPVFLYHFAVNTSVIQGAAHGEATAYETLSSIPWAQCDHSNDEEKCKKNQMAIAQHFHDYICSFILTGDPNKAESRSKAKPMWETYAPGKDKNIMLFGNGSDELAGGNSYGTPAEMSANDWPRINCGFWHKMRPLSES
ncbi:hypothetical protein KEM55_000916 [Ascosphaera atra]|nr:hypothetical protein KEM55_000916 [Ascosphaera atra]